MGVQSLISRIVGRQTERREAAVDGYRRMVSEAAEGKEPPDDLAEQLLHDSGKTVEDLRKDIGLAVSRRNWRQLLEKEPELIERRAELEARRLEAEAKLNEQVAAAREEMARIETDRAEVRRRLDAVAEARAQLVRTAHVPPELQTVNDELCAAVQRLQAIDKQEFHAAGRMTNVRNTPVETAAAVAAHSEVVRRKTETERQISDLRARLATLEESLLCQ